MTTVIPLHQREFPELEIDHAVEEKLLALDFIDISCHNDACPSFINFTHGLVLWVDYYNAWERDCHNNKQYTLLEYDNKSVYSETVDTFCNILCATDSKAEILTALTNAITERTM